MYSLSIIFWHSIFPINLLVRLPLDQRSKDKLQIEQMCYETGMFGKHFKGTEMEDIFISLRVNFVAR